jgi:hypothetical protein
MSLAWAERPTSRTDNRATTRREAAVVVALLALAAWAGAHRVQTHLDDACPSSTVACALDGRNR